MFQPAEETMTGAAAMIEAGVLENPAVDAAFMVHVIAGIPIPTGSVIILPPVAAASAGSDWFKITVRGKGGHGASPEKALDPLIALSQICLSLQTINAREVAPGEQIVLTVGQMHGGNTSNVIPETAFLSGSIRTFGKAAREFVRERVQQIASGIAATFRMRADVEFEKSCPSFVVDADLQKQIEASCGELLGGEKLIPMERVFGTTRLPGSEDFAAVSEKVPTMMVMLTAGSPAEGYAYPPHHPRTAFHEGALAIGAALYANAAIEWLRGNS
jgi:hippurate hydrolase